MLLTRSANSSPVGCSVIIERAPTALLSYPGDPPSRHRHGNSVTPSYPGSLPSQLELPDCF